MTGTSSTGIGPSSSLTDFSKVYAPPGDHNDSAQYAANLANHLGVSPDTRIGSLAGRIGEFADAVSKNEGYQGSPDNPSRNSGGYQTKAFVAPTTPDASQQNADPAAPGNVMSDLGKGDYGNALQSGVRGIGSFLTGGGTETIGKSLGTGIGAAGEKIKGMLGGKDNSKYYDNSQPSTGEQLAAGGKILGSVAALYGGGQAAGALTGMLSGSGAMSSPVVESALGGAKLAAKMSNIEKLNALGEAFKTAGLGDQGEIAKAIKYLQPGPGFIKTLLKGGVSMAQKAALMKVFGDNLGGFIHRSTGK